jgi:hypothetical protein
MGRQSAHEAGFAAKVEFGKEDGGGESEGEGEEGGEKGLVEGEE